MHRFNTKLFYKSCATFDSSLDVVQIYTLLWTIFVSEVTLHNINGLILYLPVVAYYIIPQREMYKQYIGERTSILGIIVFGIRHSTSTFTLLFWKSLMYGRPEGIRSNRKINSIFKLTRMWTIMSKTMIK